MPRRTKTTIIVVYVAMIVSDIPTYTTGYLVWNFYSNRRVILLGLILRNNKELVVGMVYVFHSIPGFLTCVLKCRINI